MDLNAIQDAFAALVADCHNKRVSRAIMREDKTHYEPHDPEVELDNLPVFAHAPVERFNDDTLAALDAIEAGEFRLPFPRCAFISYLPPNAPGLLNQSGSYAKSTPRHYVVIAEEEDDGSVTFFGFVRHDDMTRWAKHVWQAQQTREHFSFAFEDEGAPDDFLKGLVTAAQDRLRAVCGIIHKMSTHNGATVVATGGNATQLIDKRRTRLGLPPVPRVRLLNFDMPRIARPATQPTGRTVMPHYRRGTWRSLATGRRVWVRASAIHGGGDSPPPWYQVR